MQVLMSTPFTTAVFPADTVDTTWTFTIKGKLDDGTDFSQAVDSDEPLLSFQLEAGTYTLTVTKNGVSSLESDPFTVAGPVVLRVPDSGQKAVIAAA